MKRLGVREVRKRLAELKGWRLTGKRIVCQVKFEGFMPGVELLNEVAKVAEEMNHHPDVYLTYGKLRFSLTTHDVGGITENDLTLAKRIDEILKKRGL